MKTTLRKLVALLLVAMAIMPLFAAPAYAATSWPSLSSSKYCEFTAPKKINVYKDSGCRTRGTSSPSKSYNAYISKNDVCRIIEITSGYIKLKYPTSSGYRTGYIRRSDLISVSSPTSVVTSSGKVTTYKTAGGASYGYVAKGDKVWAVGTSGSYTAVIYTAKSGSRAYKFGYVKTSQYNSTIIGRQSSSGSSSGNSSSSSSSGSSGSSSSTASYLTTSSSWDSRVGTTVANVRAGNSYGFYYNRNGNISARGGYTGECTWYAYGRFYEVTGIDLKTAPHAKKWLSANANDSRVRVLYGASQIVAKSIAVRTSGNYGHVMFIEHVTYNRDGSPAYVYFTECNADGNSTYNSGRDCILQKMTYADFVREKNPAGYIVKR